ncbi:hypothetical protein [Nocardia abscessus]|uniref:hypothetical protein n=1 Tax=Nocardia abscessus TaxID=120957 RepID=UPI001E5A912F|nr:hypothetical protein [Nocardia abscessus]
MGLLAWLMQKFTEFAPLADRVEDVISRDHLLTNISLYWFTGTVASSSWPMYNGLGDGGFTWPKGQRCRPAPMVAAPR